MDPERRPEARIDELAGRLSELERRLAALERAVATGTRPAPALETGGAAAAVAAEAPAAARAETIPLIGRTLLVLAGAFLLRAITESELLPQTVGTALGIAYAIVWMLLAERAAVAERRTSASFHALASAVIAFPLIWEATVKFGFLSPHLGAAVLLAITGLGLGVAALRRMRRTAWVFTVGAVVTTLVLAVATKLLVLFVALLLVLGFATLWLGYLRGWRGLGWFTAVFADVAVLLLTLMIVAGDTTRVTELIGPASLVALQLALVLVYVGSIGVRTLSRGEEVSPEEVAQGAATVVIGLGGAIVTTRVVGAFGMTVGIVAVLLAAGSYALSFMFISTERRSKQNFIFYTTLALVFGMVGSVALLGGSALALALAAAGLVTAWLGAVRSRATLSLHAAVYTIAATVAAGLPARAADALTGPTVPSPTALGVALLVALAIAGVCCWLPVATHGRTWGRFSQAPKLAVLTVLAIGLGTVVVVVVASLLPAEPGAAGLAVLRTAIISAAALLLAGLGRTRRLPEAAWLVYPVLGAGAVKLMLEEVPIGRAGALFASLALYGGALILAPRWARRGR